MILIQIYLNVNIEFSIRGTRTAIISTESNRYKRTVLIKMLIKKEHQKKHGAKNIIVKEFNSKFQFENQLYYFVVDILNKNKKED